MGLAGSGKGTQAKMLVDKDGYSLISTGDLLRHYASSDQKTRMLSGVLLEDSEIHALIDKALKSVPDLKKCLLDGTPRTNAQAQWIMKQVADGHFTINAVLHLEVDEEIVRRRLLARGRSDDTEAGITKRFEEYHRATLPIIDYFKQNHVPVYNINGNQPAKAVHEDIVQTLNRE